MGTGENIGCNVGENVGCSNSSNRPTDSGLVYGTNWLTYAGAFGVPRENSVIGSSPVANFRYSDSAIGLSATPGNMIVGARELSTLIDGICEVTIPTLSPTDVWGSLPEATFVQGILTLGINLPTYTPQTRTRDKNIGVYHYNGMYVGTLGDSYDANNTDVDFMYSASNTDFSLAVLGGSYDLTATNMNSGYQAAGWFAEVPTAYQASFGYTHIIGHSHNWSIALRTSMGPSCFGIDLDDLTTGTPTSPITVEPFLSYPFYLGISQEAAKYPVLEAFHGSTDFTYNCARVTNPYRTSGNVDFPDQGITLGNDIRPGDSGVAIGFFVPNTRTYACIGFVSGLQYGSGYKIVRDEDFKTANELAATYVSSTTCTVVGNQTANYYEDLAKLPTITRVRYIESGVKKYAYCDGNSTFDGSITTITIKADVFTNNLESINQAPPTAGPAPYVATDWNHFYWLYDIDDLIEVKNGTLALNEVVPYDFGTFDTQFMRQDVPDDAYVPRINMGCFDSTNNRLYLSLQSRISPSGEATPLILAYDV